MARAPRRISSRRRKQIDIVCSRGRRSRPPALPFLVRSNSRRAALAMPAPWAGPILAGPPLRVSWAGAVDHAARLDRAALPGLAMPSGACARSSRPRCSWSASAGAAGPSAAARGQLPPDHLTRGRGRVPWASCARRGQLPPRLPWTVAGAASAGAAAPGTDQPTGPRDFSPRFPPRFPAGIFPRNPRHRIFPRVTRGPGASPHNASAINPRITKINDGSTKISFNSFAENRR